MENEFALKWSKPLSDFVGKYAATPDDVDTFLEGLTNVVAEAIRADHADRPKPEPRKWGDLELSTEVINGAHIGRMSFAISERDGAGVVTVLMISGGCRSFDPQTADGKAVLEYAGLTRKFATAHYKWQLAEWQRRMDNGDLPEDTRPPVKPEDVSDIF